MIRAGGDLTRARRPCARDGFTLFEIAVGLLVLAVAVLSAVALFPVGIKSQQIARLQLFAANQALNLVDSWGQSGEIWVNRQVEAERLSQDTFVHHARFDFERTMMQNNLCPLPPAIAERLDSDDDEIRRIIADGGRLYYPLRVHAGTSQSDACPQELLFAVEGYPQLNALPNHPCLGWPYYDHVPGPPHTWELANWQLNQATWPGFPEFQALYQTFNSDTQAVTTPDAALAADYLEKAQALVTVVAGALSMPTTSSTSGVAPWPPSPLPPPPWRPGDSDVYPHPAWIWALSHLAHAAACQTAPQVAGGAPSPAAAAYADLTADAATRWMMRYASTDPDDWGMARDAGHLTAWDYPLLQFDVFPSAAYPLSSASAVTNDPTWKDDVSWKVVAREKPHNYGQARGKLGWWAWIPPNQPEIDASWGDPDHFVLTRAFQPCERTRQLVCFSADWQAFEDFEEQPAAPQDSGFGLFDSRGVQVGTEAWGIVYCERLLFFSDPGHRAIDTNYITQSSLAPLANQTTHKAVLLGMYGADRNCNGTFDRGPLPKSARLRATTIGRFNFYDRIVPFSVRG